MRELIDLERYPLDRLDSAAGRELVDDCIARLGRDGMFTLEAFMHAPAIEAMLPRMLRDLRDDSFTHAREHNIYFDDAIDGVAAGHPALARVRTVNHTLCGDQLDRGLLEVYRWPPLAEFLACVMGKRALYPMADELACANVLGYFEGEGLNWHFDRSEFTTTLLLQAPEAGGEFEYRRDLRSADDPNYEGVARLLEGRDERVSRLRLGAGDLNVFKGKNTAHRVTPPAGERARLVAVFSYYETPGRRFSERENLGFYGRTGARS